MLVPMFNRGARSADDFVDPGASRAASSRFADLLGRLRGRPGESARCCCAAPDLALSSRRTLMRARVKKSARPVRSRRREVLTFERVVHREAPGGRQVLAAVDDGAGRYGPAARGPVDPSGARRDAARPSAPGRPGRRLDVRARRATPTWYVDVFDSLASSTTRRGSGSRYRAGVGPCRRLDGLGDGDRRAAAAWCCWYPRHVGARSRPSRARSGSRRAARRPCHRACRTTRRRTSPSARARANC